MSRSTIDWFGNRGLDSEIEYARSQGFTAERTQDGTLASKDTIRIWEAVVRRHPRGKIIGFRRALEVTMPNGNRRLILHETFEALTDAVNAPVPSLCRIVCKYHEGFVERNLASAQRAGVDLDATYADLVLAVSALDALNHENGLGSYFTLVYTENADRHDYPMKGSTP
jgi:hypothetical protein